MTIFIYAIRHGITREALHVGQTKNLRARFNGHRCVNGKFPKIGQPPWCLPFPFPVKMELLAVTDSAHANEAEQFFFEHYKQRGQVRIMLPTFRRYLRR